MQGKLEDSDSRIQNIKQIHDQQNKKIKQIDQEKVKFILFLTWKISSSENRFLGNAEQRKSKVALWNKSESISIHEWYGGFFFLKVINFLEFF